MSDPRGRGNFGSSSTDEVARRLADLSSRLSEARRNGEPAPEELERLVSMAARQEIDSGERLANALEGLTRWAESAKTLGGETSDRGNGQHYEQRLEERYDRAPAERYADYERPAPQPQPQAQPQTTRGGPAIASLRAALADIAERQKALDAEEEASWRPTSVRQQASAQPAPRREPEPAAWTPAPAQRETIHRPEPTAAAPVYAEPRQPARVEPVYTPEPVRAPEPARAPEKPSVDPSIVRGMRDELHRLGLTIEALPTRSEIDGLIREMSGLAERIDVERPARLDPAALRAIDSLVGQVDRMRGEAASPQMVAHLSEELKAIGARLDVLGPRNTQAIETLERRIEDVRHELSQLPGIQLVDRLTIDIQNLVQRIDAQERQSGPALKELDNKIMAIADAARVRGDEFNRMNQAFRAELENLPRAADLNDLGRQIDALTEGLKSSRAAPAPAVTAFKDLSGKVDALDAKIEAMSSSAHPDALDSFSRQIEELAMSVRRSEPTQGAADDLAARFDVLGKRMDQMVAEASARANAFDRVEDAVKSIADRLTSQKSAPATLSSDLDATVGRLVEGFERNSGRLDDLNAAFAGLASRIEQSASKAGADAARTAVDAARQAISGSPAGDLGGDLAEILADLRSSAAHSERRTAETLETVRHTLERLLDRMEQAPRAPLSEPQRPRQNDYRAETAAAPAIDATEAARAAARRAIAEMSSEPEPRPAPRMPRTEPVEPAFQPISDLAPDHPIEPNSVSHARGDARPDFGAQGSASQTAASFIAAARRAQIQSSAEDEAVAPEVVAPKRGRAKAKSGESALAGLKSKKRPLLLVIGATLIVLAALYVASGITGSQPELAPEPAPSMQSAPEPAPQPAPQPRYEAPAAPQSVAPEKKSEIDAPLDDQQRNDDQQRASELSPEPTTNPPAQIAAPRAPASDLTSYAFSGAGGASQGAAAVGKWKAPDPVSTGSISAGPANDLPDSIGNASLKSRAKAGDAAAQLEVADRLLDGRNVTPNPEAAARWLEKAANQGLAPAQQRLGSLYEKGRGVGRDIQSARRWYEQAAASGNVRAMHNLGVIHAEGGLGKPDYSAASVWFRMAAERGLADSQYNLAVLDARGLAGKRDLVDAYKWFALAAAQGDDDAATKRDEVGKALGKSLPTAQSAVSSFRARPTDSGANEAPAPAGGWDQTAARTVSTTPIKAR